MAFRNTIKWWFLKALNLKLKVYAIMYTWSESWYWLFHRGGSCVGIQLGAFSVVIKVDEDLAIYAHMTASHKPVCTVEIFLDLFRELGREPFSESIYASPMACTVDDTDSFLSCFCKPRSSSWSKTPRIGRSEDYLARLSPNILAQNVKDEQKPAMQRDVVGGKRLPRKLLQPVVSLCRTTKTLERTPSFQYNTKNTSSKELGTSELG